MSVEFTNLNKKVVLLDANRQETSSNWIRERSESNEDAVAKDYRTQNQAQLFLSLVNILTHGKIQKACHKDGWFKEKKRFGKFKPLFHEKFFETSEK